MVRIMRQKLTECSGAAKRVSAAASKGKQKKRSNALTLNGMNANEVKERCFAQKEMAPIQKDLLNAFKIYVELKENAEGLQVSIDEQKLETKGKRIASPVVPPRPGRIPTERPNNTPSIKNIKCCGSKSCNRTENNRSIGLPLTGKFGGWSN